MRYLCFLLICLSACLSPIDQATLPNIIMVMTDDLGYGDVQCYGGEIPTPHIDRLASEGLLLTDYHSNGAMCSPTRAAFLTGMYQNRLGPAFESALNGRTQKDVGLPQEILTLPEMLRDAGYTTGIFGKWHLGYQKPHLPTDHGFDEFVGLLSGDGDHHSHISRWGGKDWWHQDEIFMEPGYTTDLITEKGKGFIESHQHQPFFAFISHLAIHFPWQGPDDPVHRQEGIDYADDKWGVIPDRDNVRPHVRSMIEKVDWSVGQLLSQLEDLNLTEKTIFIFTSDNGGYLTYESGGFKKISSNGRYRGQKTQVYEGGHRVPFIIRWPQGIAAGQVSHQQAMTMDLYPTFLRLVNYQNDIPQKLDGIDLLQLFKQGTVLPQRNLFWKMDESYAVRRGPFKLVKESETIEFYDVEKDPGEQNNLRTDSTQLVEQMLDIYHNWLQDIDSPFLL